MILPFQRVLTVPLVLNEGQLNSGTDYDWLTQCHLFFLIINFDWDQHICDVYGCSVQRVGERMSLGHFIENTSRDKPCQKCQGKVIMKLLWIIVWNCYFFTINFNSKVAGWFSGGASPSSSAFSLLTRWKYHPCKNITLAKISSLQKYHPCKNIILAKRNQKY